MKIENEILPFFKWNWEIKFLVIYENQVIESKKGAGLKAWADVKVAHTEELDYPKKFVLIDIIPKRRDYGQQCHCTHVPLSLICMGMKWHHLKKKSTNKRTNPQAYLLFQVLKDQI